MKNLKIAGISTSKTEIVDLTKAWIAISIAFAIVLTGLSFSVNFLVGIVIAAVTVGIGFLFHELAHKIVAQRYGCFAEFRAYDRMLLLAIILSVFGFIFAAPGAVMISGQVTRRENGLISIAGPWTNLVLAVGFLSLNSVYPALHVVWNYGFLVNTWLALFNMIPFWVLDGKKIYEWNRVAWFVTVSAGLFLMLGVQNLL